MTDVEQSDMQQKVVPFYANRDDDLSCRLAVTGSALEFFSGKKYSWPELEALVGFRPNKPAWTLQLWTTLAEQGYTIRMIEAFDYDRFRSEGAKYLHTFYSPDEAEWQLQNTNVLEIQPLIGTFLQQVKYEKRSPALQDIDDMLADGFLVCVQLNSRTLNGRPGYISHVVLVFDKVGAEYVAHDPGLPPQANRHIKPDLLFAAMGGEQNTNELTGLKL